jgi:hydrogenase maturation protein HypF
MTTSGGRSVVRRLLRVQGVVQGVGFRPFVHTLAGELSLTGSVLNTGSGVLVEVQGAVPDVERFCHRVRSDAPPLAKVDHVLVEPLSPGPDTGFTILPSLAESGRTLVPADVATCDACLEQLRDPADRRHKHPFISCTACGPRFTVITAMPYDRPATTMATFPMCPACEQEYRDPSDRRFHAQPIACHDCGPVLELVEPTGMAARAGLPPLRGQDALDWARTLLVSGHIVAVKGLGGYHLACDATDPVSVTALRERKRRGDKPFAIMVEDLRTARGICEVDPAEAELLTSAARPIVLLRRRTRPLPGSPDVADLVAPDNPDLGVMLPSTGLHHLLHGLKQDSVRLPALVMTSGNLASEPIVTDDAQALTRLRGIADAWLRHDRVVHVPCDDSVTRVVAGGELPLRRSRGWAPLPVPLPFEVEPSLAVGGDLRNTFALAQGRHAWLSAHVGDMDDLATQHAFGHAVEHLQGLVGVLPRRLVADRHPAYRSVQWARRTAGAQNPPLPLTQVQHHHAHIASVMAENGLDGSTPVIGLALDGTGYGEDGAVWGCEALLADYRGSERFAHLGYVSLAGGDAAVRRPYRMALAHLEAAGFPWEDRLPCVEECPSSEREVLAHQLRTRLACVPTSSAGRLFDAVASLAGVCHDVTFEAQAAMALEAAAREAAAQEPEAGYDLPVRPARAGDPASTGAPYVLDCGPLIRQTAQDVLDGTAAAVVALRFHQGLTRALVETALLARSRTGLDTVALSGGTFANTLLSGAVTAGLREAGFQVLRHHRVPCGDGGICLGQIALGAVRDGR